VQRCEGLEEPKQERNQSPQHEREDQHAKVKEERLHVGHILVLKGVENHQVRL